MILLSITKSRKLIKKKFFTYLLTKIYVNDILTPCFILLKNKYENFYYCSRCRHFYLCRH